MCWGEQFQSLWAVALKDLPAHEDNLTWETTNRPALGDLRLPEGMKEQVTDHAGAFCPTTAGIDSS